MRLIFNLNFTFMLENGEPDESRREIPLTTFKELSEALSSKRDIVVRFTIPREIWMKSLAIEKQNQDPPDEIARTGEGLLEWSQLDSNKIIIHSGKSVYVSPQSGMFSFIVPEFGEGDDEKIKNWKIVIKT